MNKILLALTILGAGAGGFLTAHQSKTELRHDADATRQAWLAKTQLVAAAQSEQAGLDERVRELKQTLTQPEEVEEDALWSALQTNRSGRLTPELRERLLEELGFNWQSSEDFIVISKETLRDYYVSIGSIRDGKLSDLSSTVLTLTPAERGQVEAAIQSVQPGFKDWVSSHVERGEPKDDVLARYTLPGDSAMSISNNFATRLLDALGTERAELITASAYSWMKYIGILNEKPMTLIVKRYLAGNEQRLKVQIQDPNRFNSSSDLWDGSRLAEFPAAFRPIFPNGWADVAKQEGFELPKEAQEK